MFIQSSSKMKRLVTLITTVLAFSIVSFPGAKAAPSNFGSDPNYNALALVIQSTNTAIQDGLDISSVETRANPVEGQNSIFFQVTGRAQVNKTQDISALTIRVQADKTTLIGQLAEGWFGNINMGYSNGASFEAIILDRATKRALIRLNKPSATFATVGKGTPAWSDSDSSQMDPATLISGTQETFSDVINLTRFDDLPAGTSLAPIGVVTNSDGSKIYSVKVLGLPLIMEDSIIESLVVTTDKNQIVKSTLETFSNFQTSNGTISRTTILTTINSYGKNVLVNIVLPPLESSTVDLETLNTMVSTVEDEDSALAQVDVSVIVVKANVAALKNKTKRLNLASLFTIAKKSAFKYNDTNGTRSVSFTSMKTSIKITAKVNSSVAVRFLRISPKGAITVSKK